MEPVVVKTGGQLSDYPTDVTPWADFLAYKARIQALLREVRDAYFDGRKIGEPPRDPQRLDRAMDAIDFELEEKQQ